MDLIEYQANLWQYHILKHLAAKAYKRLKLLSDQGEAQSEEYKSLSALHAEARKKYVEINTKIDDEFQKAGSKMHPKLESLEAKKEEQKDRRKRAKV